MYAKHILNGYTSMWMYWQTYRQKNIPMDLWTDEHTDTHRLMNVPMDVQTDRCLHPPYTYLPSEPKGYICLYLNVSSFFLSKAIFLHLKGPGISLENLETALGMNPNWIYTLGGSCMSFVMNMLIMCHFDHLSTNMEGINLKECLKAYLKILTKLFL